MTVDDALEQGLDDILGKKFPRRCREYHIRIARKPISSPLSISRGDFGCYIGAYSVKEAWAIAKSHYPSPEYSIVQVKPIA